MNISFFYTTEQVKTRTKDVTRRLGWKNLKPGTRLTGIVKGQGLKPGEKIQKLCEIEVVSVRREKLRAMWDDIHYGFEETRREGFGEEHPAVRGSPTAFVEMFCSHMNCTPETEVQRIEFKYV